jgi:hypothetical protein
VSITRSDNKQNAYKYQYNKVGLPFGGMHRLSEKETEGEFSSLQYYLCKLEIGTA